MPTTTNYGWTTPADTDLVKNGASAIRTLGTAIDTTVFNNASAAIAKTIVDAKGDLIVATAADTVARLAVGGTNGHVLQVDSSTASGLKWDSVAAGGMTLISTTTLSGASVTLSSIPQTYNSLYIVITGVTCNTTDGILRLLPNNVDNLSNYTTLVQTTVSNRTNNTIRISDTQYSKTDANNAWVLNLDNYTSTTRYKPFNLYGFYVETGTANYTNSAFGAFRSNSAITSLVFDNFGFGDFASGTILLYGVK
jgi:hypothetical protein